MLFDFFAIVDVAQPLAPKEGDSDRPFGTLAAYASLSYHAQESRSEHTWVVSLHKHPDESQAVYRDDTLEVYIFGYCFTRLDSAHFPQKERLSAECLAQGYRTHGAQLLHEIKGSFALLILEKDTHTTHVFTDPLNVRPVYYYWEGTQLVVSTALSALLRHRQEENLSVVISRPAVMEYYLFEYPLHDDTYVTSVPMMPAGGALHFSSDGLRVATYWNVFERLGNFTIRYQTASAVDALEDVLHRNLDLYLSEPSRTAVALTGGYDSRTNLALLGERAKDYLLYSYGVAGTYDLSIPRQIARELDLNYRAILLDEAYRRDYPDNARLAIGLGDGLAEANRANYPFAFRRLSPGYDAILTGLFGSELIKHPTSVGNFINRSTKELLASDEAEPQLDAMLAHAAAAGYLDADALRTHGDELKQRALTNPCVVNDHPLPVRYFYYLLMIGIRKYFMKEIKVERPFVENLHPFFDLEFIELLLQTPFPWVHHWQGQKDLVKSTATHRFYATIIQRNQPPLANILTTHGYTPRYLLNLLTMPMVALQYAHYRRKIIAGRSFRTDRLVEDYFRQHPPSERSYGVFNPARLRSVSNEKNTVKLASLQQWLDQHLVPDSSLQS